MADDSLQGLNLLDDFGLDGGDDILDPEDAFKISTEIKPGMFSADWVIAECRQEIEMARLLCLKAAWMMDQGDARAAAPWISQIKVVAPRMALKVLDEAMQMHGGQGISQDTPLAMAWTWQRALRFADGPDAVHRRQVARTELRKYTQEKI
jgi:acyl-CoA dehydrogenase